MQAKIEPSVGWVSAFTAVVALGLATGCGPKTTEPAPVKKDPADTRVRMWCGDEQLVATFGPRAKAWAYRNAATVEIVAREADADVLLVPPARLGRLDPPAALQPVPPTVSGEGGFRWSGLLDVYQYQFAHWGSERYALPLVGEAYVLLYRADQLAAAPRTWDALAEAGRSVTERTGKPALPPLPADPAATVAQLGHVAAPYDRVAATSGGKPTDAKGPDPYLRGRSFFTDVRILRERPANQWEVRIQAPAFAEAFRWFARTAKYRPAQPGDPTAAVVSGSAVAAVVPVGELAKLPKDPATGAVDARFGIGPVPGSDEYFDDAGGRQKSIGLNRIPHYPGGGLVGVVRKSATHPDAAWSLLAELGGPQGSAATLNTPAVGGGPVRVDHTSENTRAWQQYGFDQARTADLSRAVWEYVASGTLNPALGLRTPDVDAVHTLLARTLAKVATGELTADAGHQLAVKEWKEHDDKTPREQRLNARQKAAGVD